MDPTTAIAELDATTLNLQRQQGSAFVLVDVREPWEHKLGTIAGARLLPLSCLAQELATFDVVKDARIVTYCHHGVRSLQAASRFLQAGYTNVASLKGGIDSWSQRVDPSLERY